MTVELNHSIIWCRDKRASADFLAGMLGRPAPVPFHHFLVVDLDNGVSIDFMEKEGPVAPQHYAFLVDEESFDAILGRLRERGLDHWADPARSQPGRINHFGGGRGVYFTDPDEHLLEAITRPYPRD
ncbi:VOC family protein [Rhizorhabdus dicambivorans]|uniref:Glyoxalase/bleomycin resistance/extradiol dioxygenase family protein n=1 Tax=Rhizorhabdus dicambivorans TaxID=1850238 RepID=A0A2A4FZQ4_9SPHN|nr:VOC family protein [Rhizorhabdus dicambivorans]ATE63048.1 glyoxalase/bleomycin resistance/extradiol dioxygenase family protein [Rhizorhabdus dicambivorans]PCE43225.1 glyoxalase/bleomycin resistance/extradiol dioxygenase family protein [Rhizorhabdus dicambivorans]